MGNPTIALCISRDSGAQIFFFFLILGFKILKIICG